MKWFIAAGMILLLAAISAACVPLPTTRTPFPSDTPVLPSPTSTTTPVWFPPTPTYTPFPAATLSITPTVDIRPKYGALLFADDFSDASLWALGKIPVGNIALGPNELTLAVTQERGYLFSLRQGTKLGDFYAEITASPTICRGFDEFGMLLRVSPTLEFMRFSLTCNGQARVDRFVSGRASSPALLTPNSAIPRGAPSASRLALWVSGKEFRFYINGTYLFTIRDPSLTTGGLGVFTRASSADPVTVNFSELLVYEVVK